MPCSSGAAWGSDPKPNRDQKIIIEHRTVSEPVHVPPYQPYAHMPCNSGPDRVDEIVEQNRILGEQMKSTANILGEEQRKNRYLEACLCALINEMIREVGSQKTDEILMNAGERGQIDIFDFWEEHRAKDISRLENDLKRYSDHEMALLLELLSGRPWEFKGGSEK